MKKKEINAPEIMNHKPHITEVLNDHPLIEWIVDNRTNLLYIFAIVVVAIFVITRFSMGAPGQKEANIINAETEFVNLQRVILGLEKGTTLDQAYDKVNQLLKKYPELHSKYDAPIAQAFLAVGKATDAQPFAEESLKRTQVNDLSLYQDFGQTTLLISQEKYKEALAQAQKLKESLIQEAPNKEMKFGSVLFAYNLIRIATLNKTLGNNKEELDAWKEWGEYSKTSKNNINSEAFNQVTKQLENGNILLTDYIAQREKELRH